MYLNIYLGFCLSVFEFCNIFKGLKYMQFLTNTNIKFKVRFNINNWGIFFLAMKLSMSVLGKLEEDQWKIVLSLCQYLE